MKELILAGILALAVLALASIPTMASEPILQPPGVDIQSEAVYGNRPITITVSVVNPFSEPVTFTSRVGLGGPAWGGESLTGFIPGPYTLMRNIESDSSGWWIFNIEGWMEPGSTTPFTFTTTTGKSLGVFPVVSASYQMKGQSSSVVTRTIRLTEGTGSVTGRMDVGNGLWRPGESRDLTLIMEAPVLTQFQGRWPFTSTCGITGLPEGFFGWHEVTYQWMRWHVTLPADARPGLCTISGAFTAWTGVWELNQIHYIFEVPYRYQQFFPLINSK